MLKYQSLLIIVIFLFISFSSCNKFEYITFEKNNYSSEDITNRFFLLPKTVSPSIRQVANELKMKNQLTQFITEIIKNEGYVIWDKAKISTRSVNSNKSESSISSSTGDTIVILPLVLDSTGYVNAFIEAKINDSIVFHLNRESDYLKYQFGSAPIDSLTADKFVLQMMLLNRDVFGYNRFLVTDNRLFNMASSGQNNFPRQIRIKEVTNNNITGLYSTIEVCYIIQMPNQCTCADPTNCDWDDPIYEGNGCPSCSRTDCEYYNLGGGGLPGGGTGGTYFPPYPPPPPSGGGGGWHIISTTPVLNPCEIVDSLVKMPNYVVVLNYLKSIVPIVNYELAVGIKNPLATPTEIDTVPGIPGTLSVSYNTVLPIDALAHSHYNDPQRLAIFSFDDMISLYQLYNTGKIKDTKSFTFAVVTDSSSYIMMITNTSLFRAFGNQWIANSVNKSLFNSAFYDAYGISESRSISDNEINFLRALQIFNTGISLFRGDSNFSKFTKLRLNENANGAEVALCN